ncbi:tetratricopeptide repeat protein [Nocardia sp. NPDC050406]|uniref:tetratricopeptide repeat protein n=1 Tax=Nocardia sp. NPDC050406 TaxID=3364318 RepID=UPI0037B3F4A0
MTETSRVLEKARAASDLGRFDEARELVGKALVGEPHDPELLGLMADLALRADRVDEALRMAGLAIAADPDRVDAHLVAAQAFEAAARREEAVRHARVAVSLEPENVSALLVFAGILSRGFGPTEAERGEARTAVVRALRLAPGADTHAAAAELEMEFGDRMAATRHVEDGLALNSLHPDLLLLRARLDVWRGSPFAALRGLFASRPGHLPARQLLAATTWRSLLRLAAWVWIFAGTVAVLSIWFEPGTASWLTPVLLAVVPIAWVRVYQVLRRQLPEGYLRRRVRGRSEAVAGLSILVVASLVADLGAVLLRLDSAADSTRTAYLLLVVAALGAGLGHASLFCAWMRRNGGEENSLGSFGYASTGFLGVTALGVVGVAAIAALAQWSDEPAAAWTLATVVCVAAGTLALEIPLALAVLARRRRRRRLGGALVALTAPLVLLTAAAFCWTAAHVAGADYERRTPPVTEVDPATTTPPTTSVTVTPTTTTPPPEQPAPPPAEQPAPPPAEQPAPPPPADVLPPAELPPPPPPEEIPPPA